MMIVVEILNHYHDWEERLCLGSDIKLVQVLRGLLDETVWGDIVCLGTLVTIFNISISVISPQMEIINIFHEDEDPDIIIVGNGGVSGSSMENTHFSATCKFCFNIY